ncbi:acyl carrier protein [Ideonella sp.]|uniref:acyl carrier protein n=1 Tax=Ideonella sp. TaxID=1929293 RepID=UPI0035B49C9F
MTTQRSIIERELVRLLADIVQVDPATVMPEAGLADLGITSLQLVEVIFSIEEKYGISIPYNANEGRLESVGVLLDTVVDLIEAKAEQGLGLDADLGIARA